MIHLLNNTITYCRASNSVSYLDDVITELTFEWLVSEDSDHPCKTLVDHVRIAWVRQHAFLYRRRCEYVIDQFIPSRTPSSPWLCTVLRYQFGGVHLAVHTQITVQQRQQPGPDRRHLFDVLFYVHRNDRWWWVYVPPLLEDDKFWNIVGRRYFYKQLSVNVQRWFVVRPFLPHSEVDCVCAVVVVTRLIRQQSFSGQSHVPRRWWSGCV